MEDHPLIKLTEKYINDYEKLTSTTTDPEIPIFTLDMLSSLTSSIEKFVVDLKKQAHSKEEKEVFPEGYTHLTNSIHKFTNKQLLWLLNELKLKGYDMEPEIGDEFKSEEDKENALCSWFRKTLVEHFVCRQCKEIGHQYGQCSKLTILPCIYCNNEDHTGLECNSSKAKLVRKGGVSNRKLVARKRR